MAVDRRLHSSESSAHRVFSQSGRSSLEIRFGVKALISIGDRILLVKEEHRSGDPFWTLPGGGIRAHESLYHALSREIAEEIQCEISIGDCVGICPYRHRSNEGRVTLYAVFNADLESRPVPNTTDGILDTMMAHRTDLPSGILPEFRERLED